MNEHEPKKEALKNSPKKTLQEQFDAINFEGLSLHGEETPSLRKGMGDQMDRLIAKTKVLHEDVGLKSKDARREFNAFNQSRTKIRQIKNRLRKLEQEGNVDVSQVKQLRSELAQTLLSYKKETREYKTPGDVNELSATAENDRNDQDEWESWNELGKDMDAAVKVKVKETVPEAQDKEKQQSIEKNDAPDALLEQSDNYEIREQIRESWSEYYTKKKAYKRAYSSYLQQNNDRSGSWLFKRRKIPAALEQAEAAYQDARRIYAAKIDEVAGARMYEQLSGNAASLIAQKSESLQAMQAKHFVLRAVAEKRSVEEQYALTRKGTQLFERMQATLKKNRMPLRILGYAVATGIGFASGNIVAALLGKKIGAEATLLGATAGAFGAGAAYKRLILDSRTNSYEQAQRTTKLSYTPNSIDALEKELLERSRKLDSAIKNEKYAIAAGAIAGGVAAGALAGNIDTDEIIDAASGVETVEIPESLTPEITPDSTLESDMSPSPETLLSVEDEPGVEIEHEDEALESVLKEQEISTPSYISEQETEPAYESNKTNDVSEQRSETLPEEVAEVPQIMFTFEEGGTTSDALFDTWKEEPSVLEDNLTKKEFLAQMYTAIAEIEKDPALNRELMEQMGITSGDIDQVQVGQTVNLQPFFEYLNQKH